MKTKPPSANVRETTGLHAATLFLRIPTTAAINLRLAAAVRTIRAGDPSITWIGQEVGGCDGSHLAR